MKTNIFLKILASIPIILIALYFLPFLGVCLIILRYVVYSKKTRYDLSFTLITVGLIILIPKIVELVIKPFKIGIEDIPYLNTILNSAIYTGDMIKYSKYLITLGVILTIITMVLKRALAKASSLLNSSIGSYINQSLAAEREISKENDLIIKEKQEQAKHTKVVHCPYCGSDNILTEKTGTCKFCRRTLENKDEN